MSTDGKTKLVLGALALGLLAVAGPAGASPRYHTYCSPKPGPHSWEDPPSGVRNPDRYANCEDCRPIASGTKCELWYGGQTSDGGVGGISHNAAEYTAPADIEAGANVLLHTLLELAS